VAFSSLTVESCTVVMLLTFILIIISIPSPPHSFIPGLKPSFSVNPSHRSLPFFLQDWLHGFPRLFTVTSEHIPSFTFYFFCLTLFSCRFRAVDKLSHVGFRAHVKIASRIVSLGLMFWVQVQVIDNPSYFFPLVDHEMILLLGQL